MVMVTIGVMSVVALVWNAFVGIVFRTSFLAALATALPLFLISAIFRRLRPNRLIAEVALYVGLWTLQPVVGVRLTYLAKRSEFRCATTPSARRTRRSAFIGSIGRASSSRTRGSCD